MNERMNERKNEWIQIFLVDRNKNNKKPTTGTDADIMCYYTSRDFLLGRVRYSPTFQLLALGKNNVMYREGSKSWG
jgi:hypothetical protein